ncbi:S-adenosylmethionine:tRNA ribosyltransferase-isomerase [Asanoa hainanensis]|uniref:S-adenosylmethionine:tRNA ribosyltransferase-isomerase n=1 Tax=Asanoa hainanensis TaxID=560556 RepID=A0A239MNV7_9ACTN|nr:S-adenosylmethionine:tRNA ribosyltransferase-isomerase [Asanoa hainanensis]SNT43943.1 S-adenosylmethionine:tRNA ribosyltransferase-isomerase [Asanoa hainanensis]
MTATGSPIDFVLPDELSAHEPPEARGVPRDGVRMLVSTPYAQAHRIFRELPDVLCPGDVLVVNTSATLPAAAPTLDGQAVHFSTANPDGTWLVEPRGALAPTAATGQRIDLRGGGSVTLLAPYSRGRLWVASLSFADVRTYLNSHGSPIRYDYVPREWPLSAYQTVFATEPGSAEMPSAARPFTDRVVTRLVAAGVQVVPIVLHTGVASAEAHERPYPEWFEVPNTTARVLAGARRVIAVGTTVVRALETTGGAAGSGWTDLVVTPERGVRVVDGLLTGFHPPRASHLDLLAAVAGPDLVARSYREALAAGYRWHEFGDVNLLLSERAVAAV